MHGVDPLAALAAPGVLPGCGTAACETVMGVQMPHPAALHSVGARMDPSPGVLVRELVHEGTPVLDR
jgi:hypothetical protein